jgi:hypothetical protein
MKLLSCWNFSIPAISDAPILNAASSKSIIWTKDAVAAAIGGIGDAACWLAYGNHEECDDLINTSCLIIHSYPFFPV